VALRTLRPGGTRARLGPVRAVGGRAFVVRAGPCDVEEGPMAEAAAAVAEAGCAVIRGGAFKPRTSPYAFQGLGAAGVRLLVASAQRHGLQAVSEILDRADLPAFEGIGLRQV